MVRKITKIERVSWKVLEFKILLSNLCTGAPPPPVHAINRGIGFEGLGTVLAGLFGSGNGTNTFGENVGAIGVTKVKCSLMNTETTLKKYHRKV